MTNPITSQDKLSTEQIAQEISILMPLIARRVLFEFFQSVNISQSQLLTIMAVYDTGKCRLSEVSERMKVSNPTASGLVDRLVQNDYLTREADPVDRRAVNLSLTSKGEALAFKFRSTVKDKWHHILLELPETDQKDFIRILKVIKEKVS